MSRRGTIGWPAVLAAAVAAALLLAACTPAADTQQIQSNQFALRGMVANNQQRLDALGEKLQRLNDRVTELEHSASGGPGSPLAALKQRVSKLESQASSSQPAGATPGIIAPGAAPSPAPGAVATPGAGGNAAADSGEAATAQANAPSWREMMEQGLASPHDDPGQRLYRAGLLDLKAGKYPQAQAQFAELQRRYPKSALSEPAEFFAANALYEMGKYDQSILQFNDQTMRFPRGRFASAALLREAQAFMKINDRIDARLTLQKLLNDHPDAPEAPMAKAMMQTLAS